MPDVSRVNKQIDDDLKQLKSTREKLEQVLAPKEPKQVEILEWVYGMFDSKCKELQPGEVVKLPFSLASLWIDLGFAKTYVKPEPVKPKEKTVDVLTQNEINNLWKAAGATPETVKRKSNQAIKAQEWKEHIRKGTKTWNNLFHEDHYAEISIKMDANDYYVKKYTYRFKFGEMVKVPVYRDIEPGWAAWENQSGHKPKLVQKMILKDYHNGIYAAGIVTEYWTPFGASKPEPLRVDSIGYYALLNTGWVEVSDPF